MHHDLLGFYFQSALRVLQVKKEETNNEIVIYMLKCNPYNKNYLHQHLAERAESEFTQQQQEVRQMKFCYFCLVRVTFQGIIVPLTALCGGDLVVE